MHTYSPTQQVSVTAALPSQAARSAEAAMVAAGYALKDFGRRPRVEHRRASDPLARLAARGAYLPGC